MKIKTKQILDNMFAVYYSEFDNNNYHAIMHSIRHEKYRSVIIQHYPSFSSVKFIDFDEAVLFKLKYL